jgi:hypothetical protein
MKKSTLRLFDLLWAAVIAAVVIMLAVPASRGAYLAFTAAHRYIVGFINFAVLATMGDLLAHRISSGKWSAGITTLIKLLVWGFIGMAITLFFAVFANGVTSAQGAGLLPFGGSVVGHAFLTSALMNLTFGPAMFIFHKFTDTLIDSRAAGLPCGLDALIARIDWKTFFKFTVFTTIPCFWIPCHTIVFILPVNIRVLMAAFLSIALGLLLSLRKKASAKS